MAIGKPSGSVLASGTTNGNTLPIWGIAWEERQITFGSPVELTEGVQYAIVIKSAAEWPNVVLWALKDDDPYANGTNWYSDDNGTSWSNTYPTSDLWFKTQATGVDKDTNTFGDQPGDSAGQAIYENGWDAQTFTASSTYTITSVVLKLAILSDTWLPGTLTIEIQTVTSVSGKAINPTPSDTADDVTLDQQTISWQNGGGALSYNVYYGTESGDLTLLESGVTDTSYTIFNITDGSPFDYTITRYWRIDSVNDEGTVEGDEWVFTTITFNAPPPGPRGFDKTGGGEDGYGGGVMGDTQINIKTRLVAFARNKVFYEDS